MTKLQGLFKRISWSVLALLLMVSQFGFAVLPFINSPIANAISFTNSPTVASSTAGIGTIAWTNENLSLTSNNQRATTTLDDNEQSRYLKSSGYGFSVPAGATIDGIVVEVEKRAGNGNRIKDNAVRIVKNNTIGAQDKSDVNFWDTTDAYMSYGSATDKWGESWTVADINSANFGFAFSAKKDSTASNGIEAAVDHVKVTVYYTEAPTPKPDLTATKTNSVSGNATINQPFTWMIRVQNSGQASAVFSNGKEILKDERSSTGVTSYGATSVTSGGGATGTVSCSATGTINRDLSCVASGAVTIPVNGYFDIVYSVTPSLTGSLSNPRANGICAVNAGSGPVSESNSGNNSCQNVVTVNEVPPILNPALTQACGLDIALVIDNSTSITSTQMASMKSAMTAFTTAFAGTPTEFSVTRFASSASISQNFTDDINAVNTAINAVPVGGGFTNWEDGLLKAQSTLTNRISNPDLVIFASDGDPTTSNTVGGTDTNQPNAHLAPAVAVANSLKTGGARVLVIGIGSPTLSRLQAISGPNVNTGNVLTSDVITTDFATLAEELAEFAAQTCGGTITTTKLIDGDGKLNTTNDQTPTSNWEFDVNGNPTDPETVTTNANGQTVAVEVEPGVYSISETVQAGYTVIDALCEVNGQSVGSWVAGSNTVTGMQIGANDIVSCKFINHYNQGTLIVKKTVINDNGSAAASPSNFSFSVNGAIAEPFEADGQNNITVTTGTYSVVESEATGYKTTYTNCTDVFVPAGGSATCIITNDDIAPKLTVTKVVSNTLYNGSLKVSDFPLFVGQVGVVSGVQNAFDIGQYVVSETGDNGYIAEFSGNCNSDGVVELLELGGEYNCTITNTAKPGTLIVYKEVKNDDGGDADASVFSFAIEGVENANFGFVDNQLDSEQGSKTLDDLAAGTYTIIEDSYPGYEVASNNCVDIVVENGKTSTCTIVNDDVAPTLTLVKQVVNLDGGNQDADAWTLIASDGYKEKINQIGTLVEESYGEEAVVGPIDVEAGVFYTLSEDGPSGYQASDWNCVGGSQDGNGVVLDLGENVTCTIINDDIAPTVIVKKSTSPYESSDEFNFTMTNDEIDTNFVLDTNSETEEISNSEEFTVRAGSVSVEEESNDDWFQTSADCYYTAYDGDYKYRQYVGTDFEAENGVTYYCEFVNEQAGEIVVTKFHDFNENGFWDDDEPTLENWEMNLNVVEDCYDENILLDSYNYCSDRFNFDELIAVSDTADYQETTGEDGTATFGNLKANKYTLFETLQEGWEQSAIYCNYENEGTGQIFNQEDYTYFVELYPGETVNCYVGNHRTPELVLEKSNNSPNPVNRGDEVTYTLTLTVPETSGRVYDSNLSCELSRSIVIPVNCNKPVTVTDLPPENIDYIEGSWTAESNMKDMSFMTEPTYASPGTWSLTNEENSFLEPGEVVTLTYKAKVLGAASNGVHPDTAFASGYTLASAQLFANESTGVFVGTDVEIVGEPQGFVLGASTELAVTGQNSYISLVVGLGLIIGVVYLSRRTRGSKTTPTLVAVALLGATMWMFSASASAATTLSVQTPESPTQSATFTLGYQVMSTDPNQDFTAELFVNGVSTATDTINVNFGDSRAFNVTLPADGTYDLEVKVNGTVDGTFTESETVILDRSAPAAPTYNGTTVNGNNYTVSVSTPAGSDTKTVDVFASTNPSFQLVAANKVGTITIVAGTTQTFDFTPPTNEKYFVAVVSRDANGVASQPVGDSEVRVLPAVITAAAVARAANNAAGNQNGQVAGESTENPDSQSENQGEVAGESTTEESSRNNTGWWIAAGILAVVVGYYIYRTQMQSIDGETSKDKKTKN